MPLAKYGFDWLNVCLFSAHPPSPRLSGPIEQYEPIHSVWSVWAAQSIVIRFAFSGIFAYLNYLTPKSRQEVLDLLVTGLKRLEYRGYDSTGVAIDSPDNKDIVMVKRTGKVKVLEDAIQERKNRLGLVPLRRIPLAC